MTGQAQGLVRCIQSVVADGVDPRGDGCVTFLVKHRRPEVERKRVAVDLSRQLGGAERQRGKDAGGRNSVKRWIKGSRVRKQGSDARTGMTGW